MLKKNDEIILTIDNMGNEGEGVARYQDFTLFVKDALPGDKIKAKVMKMKKTYGYARLLEVITPSKDRVIPKCEYARQCGGCQLQHASYESQLKFKEQKVINCLKRIGGIEDAASLMEPVIGMDYPWNYRNKAQFPVGLDKEGNVQIGFYAGHSHNIIDTDVCMIQDKANEKIVAVMRDLVRKNIEALRPYNEHTGEGILRHIITRVGAQTGEIMVCLVINSEDIDENVKSKLVDSLLAIKYSDNKKIVSISLNINRKKTNVIMGDSLKIIYGEDHITDYIKDVRYEISPMSFYQVNPVQTQKLYETALSYASLSGGENVWDLYCGIGTISLFLAKNAGHVIGVEIVAEAIENAKKNALINNIHNVDFHVGSAEDVVVKMYEKSGGLLAADVVVVDPPRKGCDAKLLDTIVKMSPQRIVYVSCDPATLARDVKILSESGYNLEKFRCVDMFGMGSHVETVCLLSKKP